MSKIRDPIQFSTHFGLRHADVEMMGAVDPTMNVDAKLFIDPLLLGQSQHSEMRQAEKTYKQFFSDVIKLLNASVTEGDIAWRTASKKLRFSEINGTCLGYGAASIRGSGFGPKLTEKVTRTAKEIIDLGVKDPDLFVVLPLLEEGVGPDLISDMTTNIILSDLVDFNERVLKALGVATEWFQINGLDARLARNPLEAKKSPVILVPADVLRDLPVANDWEEIADAAAKNDIFRNQVSTLIGDIWRVKTRKDKSEMRQNVLASYQAFSTLLEAVHGTEKSSYDLESDPDGIYVWRNIHESVHVDYPLKLSALVSFTLDEAYLVVEQIIEQFTHLVEDRGLSRELWHEGERRGEKSIQRIFFAIADSYCKANNLDISPEVDTGTGVVDFKFSSGYDIRVLVEVKLSSNSKLVPGYDKQLEVYKAAEKTTRAFYLVIDVGSMGKKDETLLARKNELISHGKSVSDIVFVDGAIKKSASKLK